MFVSFSELCDLLKLSLSSFCRRTCATPAARIARSLLNPPVVSLGLAVEACAFVVATGPLMLTTVA